MRTRSSVGAPKGLLARFRFYPGTKVEGPYFALGLSGKQGGLQLRISGRTVDLLSGLNFIASHDLPKSGDGQERVLALVPDKDSGFLFLFVDDSLAFFVSAKDLSISDTPSLSVFGGELRIQELKVPSLREEK